MRSAIAPRDLQPRSDARSCAFCREHDGVWISDPGGELVLRRADATRAHRFASRQVEFHFCGACSSLVYALFEDAESGRTVGVARITLFPTLRDEARSVLEADIDGETREAGRARRLARWTPVRRV